MNLAFAKSETNAAINAILSAISEFGMTPFANHPNPSNRSEVYTDDIPDFGKFKEAMVTASNTGHGMVLLSKNSDQSAATEGRLRRTIIVCDARNQKVFESYYSAFS